jgi:hypothetical protein
MRFLRSKVILIFWIIFQAFNAFSIDPIYDWKDEKLNTAANNDYLSEFEKAVILEINKLRSNPAQYAAEYIEPLKRGYDGRKFYYPGDLPLMTQEGVTAFNECVNFLKTQKAVGLLSPNQDLSKAAKDLVSDQSANGGIGHKGNTQPGFRERIERYGNWSVRIAENIAYGHISPQQVVIYLLIDDGISSRGHRQNFLNKDFRVIGIATGTHPSYDNMCVMEFASEFQNFASK